MAEVIKEQTNVMLYYLMVPALLMCYLYWRATRRHMIELAEKLPGPKGWPIIGNALDFAGSSPGNVNILQGINMTVNGGMQNEACPTFGALTWSWQKGLLLGKMDSFVNFVKNSPACPYIVFYKRYDYPEQATLYESAIHSFASSHPTNMRSSITSRIAALGSPPSWAPITAPSKEDAQIYNNSFNYIFSHIYRLAVEYDRVLRLWIGPKLLVFLVDPRDVEIILGSHVHIDKSTEYKFFRPWLGNGLLISTGQLWRSHRKLIAPTFHLNILKGFISLFNANSLDAVQKMRKEGGKTFDCHDYMSEATVEILLETAMGVSKKTQDKSGYEYAMAVMKMCDILHLRHTKLWLRPDWIFGISKYGKIQEQLLSVIHSLTRKVLKSKKEAFGKGIRGSTADQHDKEEINNNETISNSDLDGVYGQVSALKDDLDVDENDIGEKKRLAFLDLMIEASQNGESITDEEIKEQVDTIMFEGHDTTAAGSSFFMSMMGIHPHIQDRVIQEMDEIFGDSDRPATFADTLEMKYLERCLLETLRLYPPVPAIARQLQHDVKLGDGDYILPAGCTVIIGTYKVHRRSDCFPNPDKFDPDNFLPERCADRHYYSFIPFSAGPRSCVGRKYAMLKLKVLLSTVMRNFRIKSDLGEEDFKLQADIILKRAEGFNVRLESRKKTIPVAC